MPYSSKLLDYFENPRCAGELADANAIAEVANPVCGDVMKLWLKVADDHIIDARIASGTVRFSSRRWRSGNQCG